MRGWRWHRFFGLCCLDFALWYERNGVGKMRWKSSQVGLSLGITALLIGAPSGIAHAGGTLRDSAAISASGDGEPVVRVTDRSDAAPVRPAVAEDEKSQEGSVDRRVVVTTRAAGSDDRRVGGAGVPRVRTGSGSRYASTVPFVNAGRVMGEVVVEEPSANVAPTVARSRSVGAASTVRDGDVSSVRIGLAPTNTAPPAFGRRVSSVEDLYSQRGGVYLTGGFGGGPALIPLGEGEFDALLEGLTPAEAGLRRAQLRFSAAGTGQLSDSAAEEGLRRAQIGFYNAGVSADRRIGAGGQRGVHQPGFSRPHDRPVRGEDAPRPAFWSGTTPIYR